MFMHDFFSYLLRISRVNPIFSQFFFLCMLALSGSLFSSSVLSTHQILTDSEHLASLPTTLYSLKMGESPQSVAKSLHVSMDILRKLNESRTFLHKFDDLQPGEELIVPVMPLVSSSTNFQRAEPSLLIPDNERSHKIAQLALRVGPFLADDPRRDTAIAELHRFAIDQAGSGFQHWLSRFGTARVQLDANNASLLKKSQVDLLLPLRDRQDNLLFTQGSIHHIDKRVQANLGVGMRHVTQDVVVGGNGFLDYDFSHHHVRAGIGIEYWRDFLKLGVNSYLRLSSWKAPYDNERERPANGWDIRTEAYLPDWPQLGVKLLYEQFYGEQVVLFGKDDRQHNPHAIGAGVNYTPFPLMTLSAERRSGKAGSSDTRFSLQFHYQLSQPWERQLDPEAVGSTRRLQGQRYDLVTRKNHLVLEYRKVQRLFLSMIRAIDGYSGEQKPLNVEVSATHKLARLEWSAPALIAAGGKILPRGYQNYAVVLPNYKDGGQPQNCYRVCAVAVDTQGHRSNQGKSWVRVHAPAMAMMRTASDTARSTFSVMPASAVANNAASINIVLTIKDSNDRPLSSMAGHLSFRLRNQQGEEPAASEVTLSAIHESGATGRYVATVRGKKAGVYSVTPQFDGVAMASLSATFALNADMTTAKVESLSADKSLLTGDGIDYVQFTALITDAHGNPVPNAMVQWRHSFGHLSASKTPTSAQGIASVSLKSVDKGKVSVTAAINHSSVSDASVKTMGFIEDSWDIASEGVRYRSVPVKGYSSLGFVAKAPTLGPQQLVWSSRSDQALVATLTNQADENRYTVKFRGYRHSGCKLRPLNDAIGCAKAGNGMDAELVFSADDNATLPPGRYVGDVHFSARSGPGDFEVEYLLHVTLQVVR
ncbi:inverse autotransporter beta domain-containing protein [Candidatus Symbiopectobacterium sp. NZEC127]|uniref:inverse autotransporter beta domain-containing protein n=1 Tax=Candidatus Symbiopectobacterium sp. NZEC127 TaxID=2820472 RepID=UPI002227BC11|nr:inverse autotransporter beta domain-containing protein [Candidatus Symbiopectobacterium sp. NZEC127]MCW2488095.1 inverse autotransporter beta domain-containing protein [Candidatus Symbiopectobacterium sp. NZEC127]